MDPVSASILAGGSLGAASASYFGGKAAAEENVALQRQTNIENADMMYKSWNREDNAVVRRVQDLQNAGLSPVLAAGSAAGASSPIKMEAPKTYDYASPAASTAIQGVLAASQVSKTNMDNKRTAEEIGKIQADTVNTKQSTLATRQNMEIQNIMTALQTKAISAQTARTLVETAKANYDSRIAKIDADKADVTGVTPSSSGTAKNASDAANLGKKFLEKLNPYANQQDLMKEYYQKMQERKGGK